LALGLGGCLTWSIDDLPVGPDDDDAGDDDDALDDDDGADDDDAVDGPILAATAAAMLVKLDGFSENPLVIGGAIFSGDLIVPSAEEAILEHVYEVLLPLRVTADEPWVGPIQGRQYDGVDAVDVGSPVLANVGPSSHAFVETGTAYGFTDQGGYPVPFGDAAPGVGWVLDVPDGSEWAGLHAAPAFPVPPRLAVDDLDGGWALVAEGESLRLSATLPGPGEVDVVFIYRELGSLAGGDVVGFPVEGGEIEIEWSQIPQSATSDLGSAFIIYARMERTILSLDPGSLLLSSGHWDLGRLLLLPSGAIRLTASPSPITAGEDAVFTITSDGAEWSSISPPAVSLDSRVAPSVVVVSSRELRVTMDTRGLDGFVQLRTNVGGSLDGLGRPAVGSGESPECDAFEPSGDNDQPNQSTPVVIGQVICGGFSVPADLDYYSFPAIQGVTYRFETWATRLGSPADTTLAVTTVTGSELAANDDFGGSFDSRVDWSAEGPGTRYVRVAELNAGAGEDWSYRLVTSVVP
jgi:hypothetical protein